jgi:hypothetical protein
VFASWSWRRRRGGRGGQGGGLGFDRSRIVLVLYISTLYIKPVCRAAIWKKFPYKKKKCKTKPKIKTNVINYMPFVLSPNFLHIKWFRK